MFRYFTSEEKIDKELITIDGSDAKHLKNTLRAQIGD